MLSEPRTISLLTEVIHLPAVQPPEKLREVYNEVCRTCGYENFTRIQGGARIERREPEGEGHLARAFHLRTLVSAQESRDGVRPRAVEPQSGAGREHTPDGMRASNSSDFPH